jgi:hypothetical protein
MCGTPSSCGPGSSPWWWIVWTCLLVSMVLWNTWPARTRRSGAGNSLSPLSARNVQNSTSRPSSSILSEKNLDVKLTSGLTRFGVAIEPTSFISQNNCGDCGGA